MLLVWFFAAARKGGWFGEEAGRAALPAAASLSPGRGGAWLRAAPGEGITPRPAPGSALLRLRDPRPGAALQARSCSGALLRAFPPYAGSCL